MDLVPYDSEARQIILRHGNTLVVYDERSKQLSTTHVQTADTNECPLCHRRFDHRSQPSSDDDDADDMAFVSATYFKRLASSHTGLGDASSPPSPRLRLVQTSSTDSTSDKLINGKAPPVTRETRSHGSRISSTAFSQGYFKRFFVSERELGRGGKGVVLLVKHVLDGVPLGQFACKRVPVGNSHEWLENVLMEVSLLQDMAHENLVAYRHVWLEDFRATNFGPSTPHVFILQQFCNSGTLLEHVLGPKASSQAAKEQLKDRARRFSKGEHPPSHGLRSGRRLLLEEIFSFFKDITSGLAHLHANGYVHRDLKPQNCLLHRSSGTLRVLVSDFGEMQGASVPRRPTATGYTGTISFAAPEVISRDQKGAYGNFTDKSDVFSLGMVVFFMCFGRLPYTHADLEEERNEDLAQLRAEILAWTGLREERRERTDLPEKLYSFLQLLLSHDPVERPTTESILQGIRGGTAFSEHSPSSPINEHYHSPERGAETGRPSSSHGDGPAMKRRHTRPRRPSVARVASSGISLHQDEDAEVDHASSVITSGNVDSPYDAKRPSPVHSHANERHEHDVPLLLPPRKHDNTKQALRGTISTRLSHNVALLLKLCFFLVRIWTLLRSCSPFAMSTPIAYSLSALAGLDLVWSGSGVHVSLLLAVVHVGGLYVASSSGRLCQGGHHAGAVDWDI